MFTGIVKEKVEVLTITKKDGLFEIKLALSNDSRVGLDKGASVSVAGACLTAVKFEDDGVWFDIMLESLNQTTLSNLNVGDFVNIERSAKDGAEIGGHAMSGHIDTTAEIVRVEKPSNNFVITFKVDTSWMKYIFSKGYIGLNGASLTVCDANKETGTFDVWIIPETSAVTTFGDIKVGDFVNVEIERGTQVTVDTIRDFLEEKLAGKLSSIEKIVKELEI